MNLYGITQNPDTADYFMVCDNVYCEECGENIFSSKICKSCLINDFKKKFTSWTCGNEKIDNFIQEVQLKFDKQEDMSFDEWIPYSLFRNIRKISNGYLATWKINEQVVLKYLYNNSQNVTNEFLNEVN
jgi:hypothetical protein